MNRAGAFITEQAASVEIPQIISCHQDSTQS